MKLSSCWRRSALWLAALTLAGCNATSRRIGEWPKCVTVESDGALLKTTQFGQQVCGVVERSVEHVASQQKHWFTVQRGTAGPWKLHAFLDYLEVDAGGVRFRVDKDTSVGQIADLDSTVEELSGKVTLQLLDRSSPVGERIEASGVGFGTKSLETKISLRTLLGWRASGATEAQLNQIRLHEVADEAVQEAVADLQEVIGT